MAHPRIIASRQAIALERLMAAANGIAKRHGLKKQGEALENAKARDPNFAQMLQTEALADLLEALTGSIGVPEAPPVTVETVVEKPLETIETVEILPAEELPVAIGVPKGRKR